MKKKIILISLFLILLFTTSVFARDFPIAGSASADFTNDIVYYLDKVEFPSEKNSTDIIYYLQFFIKSLKAEHSSKDSLYRVKIHLDITVTDTKTDKVVKKESIQRPLAATKITNSSMHIEYFGLNLSPGSYKITIEIYDHYPDAAGKFPEGTKKSLYTENFSVNTSELIS